MRMQTVMAMVKLESIFFIVIYYNPLHKALINSKRTKLVTGYRPAQKNKTIINTKRCVTTINTKNVVIIPR